MGRVNQFGLVRSLGTVVPVGWSIESVGLVNQFETFETVRISQSVHWGRVGRVWSGKPVRTFDWLTRLVRQAEDNQISQVGEVGSCRPVRSG